MKSNEKVNWYVAFLHVSTGVKEAANKQNAQMTHKYGKDIKYILLILEAYLLKNISN